MVVTCAFNVNNLQLKASLSLKEQRSREKQSRNRNREIYGKRGRSLYP